jgi:UDP-N-acetylmuramate dehydrogenase
VSNVPDFTVLKERFGDQFHENESLSRYTAARLGGPAAGLLRAHSTDDLIWAAKWAHAEHIPWLILGGGANVLVSDAGFQGLVIINRARQSIIDENTGRIDADSGFNLSTLGRQCISAGMAGLEWSVSVPGSVGGAVVNNAGAHGLDTAASLQEIEILDLTTSALEIWPKERLNYTYRCSALKGVRDRYLVTRAVLQLDPGHDRAILNAKADAFVEYRKRTQPAGASLGSIFKNPPGDHAGRLIEAAELKGQHVGEVYVSTKHANFFINLGRGTSSDYSTLIDLAQQTVKDRFGVELEIEIERVGDWSTDAKR